MEEEIKKLLYGREVLEEEIFRDNEVQLLQDGEIRKGFEEVDEQKRCIRCGSSRKGDRFAVPCVCGQNCFYCLRCLQMGRIKSCSKLYHLPEPNAFPTLEPPVLSWKGELSQQQALASRDIIQTINENGTRLIWAVAGAGKTEMLFEGIAKALEERKRVCLASPRVDVCLELAPRLQAAFQEVETAVLYGEMEDSYSYTQLVLATTHQLLRFREAFDVLVIDEIDAFPFQGDPVLHFAAEKARKKESALIYLTATPDNHLQKEVKGNRLETTVLPARYHGCSLPVPKLVWAGKWKEKMLRFPKYTSPIKQMDRLLKMNRRFLVFVPNIAWMLKLEEKLHQLYPDRKFCSVSSKDPERKEKVMAMREEKLDFMLTTTILERGVTFRDIDVLVIGAEDRTYTEAALVQIAGRVGRHRDHPAGEVLFFHHGKTQAMKKAVKQIQQMNKLARERGLVRQ